MRYIIYVCMVAEVSTAFLHGFSSLPEMQQFAREYTAETVPENNDEYTPSFRSAYNKRLPGFTRKLTQKLGLQKEPAFDIASFETKLDALSRHRELEGFIDPHVSLLNTKPGDHLVIIGDLQGGFHSLVRDLTELHKMGIIDKNLHVVVPDYYIIINTNLIGRTAYNLECLDVVITLLHLNPRQVFYIQGLHEDKNVWLEYSLKEQLFAWGHSPESPLVAALQRFFNTLPYAIYISYRGGEDILRISGYGRNYYQINEKRMGDFFTKPSNNFEKIYRLANDIPTKKANVRVLIKSMDGYSEYEPSEGLAALKPQDGTTTWAVFSSPTRFHQLVNQFYNDAFVIITLGEQLDQSTITLYNRDTRTLEPFIKYEQYFLVNGEKIDPAKPRAKPHTIVKVGSTMDLSKSISNMGKDLREGIIACLATQNEKINAQYRKKLHIMILDDWYTPFKARENIDYFMKEEKIDIIILPLGTPTLEASLDLLKTGAITVLFPITGSSLYRDPNLPGIINLRLSYVDEVNVLIPYVMKKYNAKNFAFFYQNDSYGLGALKQAVKILEEKEIKKWIELPYNRNTTDFKDIVTKIKEAQADALGLFSASGSTREMLRQLGVEPLVGTILFGLSFLVDEALRSFVHEAGLKYVFAHTVPSPWKSDLPIVKEYREAMDLNSLPYGVYSLEGYIGTRLLFDAMKHIKGPINHKTVRAYFEGLKNYDFHGLTLTFNPQTRELMQSMWLGENTAEWVQIEVPKAQTDQNKKAAPEKSAAALATPAT